MCGIAGQIASRPPHLEPALHTLVHRGPDDEGLQIFRAGDWHGALGFRRLAILDLTPTGHQPMSNEDGTVSVIFNGEIYNRPELRAALEGQGHRFRGTSDTECLVHGYEAWGDAVLEHLRGMFALAVWDARRERLLLARDRIGIKPLYYCLDRGGIAFASEMKALFALGAPRELDPASVAEYLRYLYVPPPATFYRSIRQLPPAHLLVWEKGAVRVQRYWDLARVEPVRRRATELREVVRATLEEAVRLHLASDVPLGTFLSGGADSSTIAAMAAKLSPTRLKTLTLVFGEKAYDEAAYARAVAAKYQTEHTEIAVQANLVETLPAMLDAFDEPFGNPTALLLYLLARETRRHVTVALAGDGGDEMFLGYPRYQGIWLADHLRRIPPGLRRIALRPLAGRLSDSLEGRHVFRRAREFLESAELAPEAAYQRWVAYRSLDQALDLLHPDLRRPAAAEARRDFLWQAFADAPEDAAPGRAAFVDVQSFLPNNVLAYSDRMSMAHSLEIRVPFCDHKVAELAASIPASQRMPSGRLKALLRSSVADLWPDVVRRRRDKVGLNPPLGVWLRRDLAPLVEETLSPAALGQSGLLDPAAVGALLAEHRLGRRDRSLEVWSLIVLESWHRSLTKASGPGPS